MPTLVIVPKSGCRTSAKITVGCTDCDVVIRKSLALRGLVLGHVVVAKSRALRLFGLFHLHPLGDSSSELGRIHAVPGPGLDGAAGTKPDHGGVEMAERLPLFAA